MAHYWTDPFKLRVMQHFFGFATATPEASLWIMLFTVTPTAADGSGGTEASGNNYARKQILINGTVDWNLSGVTVSNKTAITVGTPTGGSWGDIRGAGLATAVTGGTRYMIGDLQNGPIATFAGTPFVIGAGKLILQLTNPA